MFTTKTIKTGNVLLALISTSTEGHEVYLHDIWTSYKEAKAALTPLGWEHGVFLCDEGRMVAGWIQRFDPLPIVDPVDLVPVKAESSGGEYRVKVHRATLTRDIKASRCTCYAGRHGTPCKHLYRAIVKASGSFMTAWTNLARIQGEETVTFNYMIFQKSYGTNVAIALLIGAGLGKDHCHASLPILPAGPHAKLEKARSRHFPHQGEG